MAIEKDAVREALRRILDVERSHMFGVTTGSQTARRRELEHELEKIIAESLVSQNAGVARAKKGKKP